MVSVLVRFVESSADKPAISTVSETPGICRAAFESSVRTISVRCSDAPSGNCAMAMRYPWSCAGMKPVGMVLKPTPVSTSRPTYTSSVIAAKRTNFWTNHV